MRPVVHDNTIPIAKQLTVTAVGSDEVALNIDTCRIMRKVKAAARVSTNRVGHNVGLHFIGNRNPIASIRNWLVAARVGANAIVLNEYRF